MTCSSLESVNCYSFTDLLLRNNMAMDYVWAHDPGLVSCKEQNVTGN